MASDLTKGRIVQPKDAVGGLKALYFINFEDVGVTFNITDTDVIDEMTKSGGTALTAYKYDLKGNSNFEQSVQSRGKTARPSLNRPSMPLCKSWIRRPIKRSS